MLRANRPSVAFFDAIKALRLRQVALLLKAGYDPNLMISARGQNALQFMIDYFGATDAHFRLQVPVNKSAYVAIAKLLLDSGLDANAADLLTDETAIYAAIRYNDRDMVALLLNYVDLSLRDKNGETALMCAARCGSRQVARMLLEHLRHLEMDGYFLRQRNRFGLTPLELARVENIEAAKVITKHLVRHGHHTGALLARSSSHHALMVNRRRPSQGAAGASLAGDTCRMGQWAGRAPAQHVAPADLLAPADEYSNSDYDSDVMAGPPAPLVRRRPDQAAMGGCGAAAAGAGAGAALAPYYDPQAARFSQYLLEQQDWMAAEQQQQQQQQADASTARPVSDLDDDYVGQQRQQLAAGSRLYRSRSCVLAPAPGTLAAKQQRFAPNAGQQQPAAPQQAGSGQPPDAYCN